jgi:hypothetical protein
MQYERLQATHVGACRGPADLQVRPVRRVLEDHQMNEDEKPTPADGQLVWVVVAFIVLMLGLLTLRSCL